MEPSRLPPTEGVDPATYRRVVGRFATGVAVVTTTLDGVVHAMTVNSFTSVSLDPVLVLFCAEKASRFHAAVLVSGTWGVSVLADDSADVSAWFATRGRPLVGQLAGFRCAPGPVTGAALFSDALATLECRTTAVHDAGDHSIVLGEVLAADVPRRNAGPLLYYEGRYRSLPSA